MSAAAVEFTIHADKNITGAELSELLTAAGWNNGGDQEASMAGSSFIAYARDGEGKLLGYVSALSDGVFTAFVNHIVVRAEVQRCGIGRALLAAVEDHFRGVPLYAMPFTDTAGLFLKSGYANKLEKWRTMVPVSKKNPA